MSRGTDNRLNVKGGTIGVRRRRLGHFRTDQAYLRLVTVAGGLGLAWSFQHSLQLPEGGWLYLALLTIAASFFRIRIPFFQGQLQSLAITISDLFIFVGLLFYGPEVSAIIAFLDASVGSVHVLRAKRYQKFLFNLTQMPLAALLSGHLFYAMLGTHPPLNLSTPVVMLILALGVSAFLYFVLNSGAVAVAVALSTGKQLAEVWTENFLWASLTTLTGASAAAVVFTTFESQFFVAISITVPVLLLIHNSYRLSLDRVTQARAHLSEMDELYHSTIASLAMAIDAKDQSTHSHVQRVQILVLGLARRCGVSDETELKGLRAAALLHDIGKLAIPEYILNKPTSLTDVEMNRMKTHPEIGAEILDRVAFPFTVSPYVRHHHERWDGAGYPDGLRGEEIPLGARILSLVDCYDALRSERPYRAKLSQQQALEHVLHESGKAFDPTLVELLVSHIDELEAEVSMLEEGLRELLEKGDTSREASQQRPSESTVFEDMASTQREFQAVYQLSQAVGRSLDLAQSLSLLGEHISQFLSFDALAIYLVDAQRQTLVAEHVSGECADQLKQVQVRFGDGIAGWVAANRQSLVGVSPEFDFKGHESLMGEFRSSLAVALSSQENTAGVIVLYYRSESQDLDEHQRVLESIAPHAADTIVNASLYEQAQEQARTDPVTGLPNRRHFLILLEKALTRESSENPLTLLMMDMDGFKQINDQFGHNTGDEVLIEVAEILRRNMRSSDSCGRLGGDEFVAVMPGVGKQLALRMTRQLKEEIAKRTSTTTAGERLSVGVSIGVATCPEDGSDAESLLRAADQAMYREKFRRGKLHSSSQPELHLVKDRSVQHRSNA